MPYHRSIDLLQNYFMVGLTHSPIERPLILDYFITNLLPMIESSWLPMVVNLLEAGSYPRFISDLLARFSMCNAAIAG